MFGYIDWKMNMLMLTLSVGLTFLAGYIAGMITGEKMSNQSVWYSALLSALIPFLFNIFIYRYQFSLTWIAVIIANIVLFFVLPLWWKPADKSKKIYCYLVFLMFNAILGLALFWIVSMVSKGY